MAFVQSSSSDTVDGITVDMPSMSMRSPSLAPNRPVDPKGDRAESAVKARRHPANDDAKFVGDMLRSMQYRPSIWPYLLALLACGIYAGSVIGFARVDLTSFTPDQDGLLKAAVAACPFILFLLLASFARQVLRVRHSADAMARVAVHLVMPAASAQDEVVSLSQTVRMEIASLGDGIERGIMRIGDMELVASDLLRRLEQSYASADAKMHALTRRLSNERESLETYAERVGDTILNSRKQIDLDLKMAGEQISSRVREAALEIMSGVEVHARSAIGQAEGALEDKARELGAMLEQYIESVRATADLANNETGAMQERLVRQSAENVKFLQDLLAASEREFGALQDRVVETFAQRTEGMAETMQNAENNIVLKADELLFQLTLFQGPAMKRLAETSEEIRTAGESMTEALNGFEGKIDTLSDAAKISMDALAATVQTELETQIAHFDAQADRNISILNETLGTGVQSINATLIGGLREFSDALDAAKTAEQMRAAVIDLRGVMQTGLRDFRGDFAEVSEALSGVFVSSTERVTEDVVHASEVALARVQDASERLAVSVQDTGAMIINDLTALNRELLKSVESAAAASARTVHEAANLPLAEVQRENKRIKEEAVSSLKKLSELNNVIRSTIAAAEKRIGAVSKSLVNQTEIFVRLVDNGRELPGSDTSFSSPAHAREQAMASRKPPEAAVEIIRALKGLSDGAGSPSFELPRVGRPVENRTAAAKTLSRRQATSVAPVEETDAADRGLGESVGTVDRESPDWMSTLLARASDTEDADVIAAPDRVSDVVHVQLLGEALASFARGELIELGEDVYSASGLAMFQRIQDRYATEVAFRSSADKLAASFVEALVDHLRSGAQLGDWSNFIDDHLAGLMTAHATGAFPRDIA
jgi:hypothetical protein